MNKKVCEKCGSKSIESAKFCENCGKSFSAEPEYNIKNVFLELSEREQEKNKNTDIFQDVQEVKKIEVSEKKESIITEVAKEENKEEEKIEKEVNKIDKKSTTKKKKKKQNKFLSYLILIEGLALLFIIIFATLEEFIPLVFFHYVITVFIMMIAFGLAYRGKELGYMLSIIASISMIFMLFERDFISVVIGAYLFTSSFVSLVKK